MKTRTVTAAALAIGLSLSGVGTANAAFTAQEPLQPVSYLDVARYTGVWHQVAAVPQPYTLQCTSNTNATYELIDADTISVVNRCGTFWGGTSTIKGEANVLDTTTNAQLKVKFDTVPFDSSPDQPNYIVTYIDTDYTWALVGDPKRRSGFVLSRSRSLTPQQWDTVTKVVKDRGYSPWLVWITPTDGGESIPRPLALY